MSRWRSGLPKTEAAGVPAGLPHCPVGALTGGDAAVSELRDEGLCNGMTLSTAISFQASASCFTKLGAIPFSNISCTTTVRL